MVRVRSGIGVVEETWGGLYRGGTYLLVGPPGDARRLLALRVAGAGVRAGERGLLVSTLPPADLLAQAARAGLDLYGAYEEGRLRLLQPIPPPGPDDPADAERALGRLLAVARREAPDRVVLDGLLPLAALSTFEPFRLAALRLLVALADASATAVLTVDEPANARARDAFEFLRDHADGVIRIEAEGERGEVTCTLSLRSERPAAVGKTDWTYHLSRLARSHLWEAEPERTPPERPSPRMEPEPPRAAETLALPPPPPPKPQLTGAPADAPATIRFLDLGTRPPAPPSDPLRGSPAADALRLGWFVGSEGGSAARRLLPETAPAPDEDPFRYVRPTRPLPPRTEGRLVAPSELADAAPMTPPASAPVFAAAFDAARRAWEQQGQPFLALALRLPAGHPTHHVTLLSAGLEVALNEHDAFYVHEGGLGMAALLIGRSSGAAPPLFRRLRTLLEEAIGGDAGALLGAAAAVLAPNGHPFDSGAAFLAYVFGEG